MHWLFGLHWLDLGSKSPT